jgi:hypothetical protein
MSALQVYLVHKNRYRAIFGSPALSLDSAQDRQSLADSIDAELSPENLTCDGELPRESVASRYRTLTVRPCRKVLRVRRRLSRRHQCF